MERTTEVTVRGYHVDLYGHVNNARYLEFLEEARWEIFEKHLDLEEWAKSGFSFFVVNINISYKRPAFLAETIEVESGITKFGTKSGTLRQTVYLKGTDTVIAEADVTFVIADSTGKAIPIEGDLLEKMAPLKA